MWLTEELRKLDPSRSELRKFGLIFGGAVLAFGAFAWYRESTLAPYLLGIAGVAILLGLLVPASLRGFFFVWMTIGLVLGAIVTRIILGIVFLVAITPIGLVMRLLGKDPLQRKLEPDSESYWIPKTYTIEGRERLEKYF